MNIIQPKVEFLTPINRDLTLELVEQVGRTCYKSEDKITDESASKFVKMLVLRGHEAMIEHVNVTIKFVTNRGCCYDDETKVLTKDGWKLFKNTSKEDEFYTLDEENNIVWSKSKKQIKEKFRGNLDMYKTTQIDLAVTPNHNMWVYDYNKRSEKTRVWKFIQSKDMTNKAYKFNKSANPIKNEGSDFFKIEDFSKNLTSKKYDNIYLKSDAFFKFLGLWVTDGSISFGKNYGGGNRIVITQIKPSGREYIENVLEDLGLDYTKYDSEFLINSPILFYWLHYHFIKEYNIGYRCSKTYDLKMPRFMFHDLSKVDLDFFLEGVIVGDGSKMTNGNGFQIYSASENFCEDIVELALLVGKNASYARKEGRDRVFPNGILSKCVEQYVISLKDRREHLFRAKDDTKYIKYYDGYVYCVELESNHRLYVMRNGKPVWCGNSHEIVRHRLASYAQESTRYVNHSKSGNGINVLDIASGFKYDLANEKDLEKYECWLEAMENAEMSYLKLIKLEAKPEEARSVLPIGVKTEINMTCNLREWRHFIKLRASKFAHPEIRVLAIQVYDEFVKHLPEIFLDLEEEIFRG